MTGNRFVCMGLVLLWTIARSGLAYGSNLDEAEAESATAGSAPFSLRIEFEKRQELDFHDRFRVVLTNISAQPRRILHPATERGHRQLSLKFVNERTRKEFLVVPKSNEDPRHWKWREFRLESEESTIELAPGEEYVWDESLRDFSAGGLVAHGLPRPNTSDRYRIHPQFSAGESDPAEPVLWTGDLQGERSPVLKFTASRLKTPQDYLLQGFTQSAIAIIERDRRWLNRQRESTTPLHAAAQADDVEAARWLLAQGADVNATSENGFTALHLASDSAVIELLLEKKPKLNAVAGGNTPLQQAAKKLADADKSFRRPNWTQVVELLVAAGAEYDLRTAILRDDLDRVKAILSSSPAIADDYQSRSPLRLAASHGRVDICRYLIEEHRVDVDDFKRGLGFPIVKEALPHPEVVRLLIDAGADLNTRITWQGGRSGPAIFGDDATLLHYAAAVGAPETIRLLIERGVEIFSAAKRLDGRGGPQFALEIAAIFGKAENAEALVGDMKFFESDPVVRQGLLDECLAIAAATNTFANDEERPRLVEVLLMGGAEPNVEIREFRAIQFAASGLQPKHRVENAIIREIVRILVEGQAEVDLYSAAALGDEEAVDRALARDPKTVSARGPDGRGALHVAVKMDYPNIVKKLLAAGCDVDIRTKNQQGALDATALCDAAFWDRLEIAKILLDAGADVNAQHAYNQSTPLHDAARMNNLDIVRLLLALGANVDAKDNKGKTPLDWAGRRVEVKKLFDEFHRAAR